MVWKEPHSGDDGYTDLGSQRVWKGSPEIELLGSIDELIAVLGIVKCCAPPDMSNAVEELQRMLMRMCGMLASRKFDELGDLRRFVESRIDDLWKSRRLSFRFDIAGPPACNAYLHLSRAVCRRAERWAWRCVAKNIVPREFAVVLNRVSDLLYAMAIAVRSGEG